MKRLLCVLLVAALLLPCIPCVYGETADDPIISALVHIDARENFAFRNNLSNSGTGESSPITQDYYLSKYKVTNAQYKVFIDETGRKTPRYWKNSTYPAGKADHPVLNVSYSDAAAYCQWLSAKYDDWNFRLPTEAEWENAAMGTYYGNTSVKYPSNTSPAYNASTCTMTTDFNFNGVIAAKLFRDYGTDYVVNYIKGDYAGSSETLGQCIQISSTGGVTNWANHSGNATKGYFLQTDLYATISADGGYTTPVGSYSPNTLGLFDMAGNCWDLTSSTIVAVNGLEAGVSCYAVRGGSWYATSRSCTFYYRGEGRKDNPSSTVGFRLAADYVGDNTTDEKGHWYACPGCQEQGSYAAHDFENACDTDCSICGYTRETTHKYSDEWTTDSQSHWRACSGCGLKKDEGAHEPGAGATTTSAQICTVCEYEIAPALGEPDVPTEAPVQPTEATVPEQTPVADNSDFPWWIVIIAFVAAAICAIVLLKKKK